MRGKVPTSRMLLSSSKKQQQWHLIPYTEPPASTQAEPQLSWEPHVLPVHTQYAKWTRRTVMKLESTFCNQAPTGRLQTATVSSCAFDACGWDTSPGTEVTKPSARPTAVAKATQCNHPPPWCWLSQLRESCCWRRQESIRQKSSSQKAMLSSGVSRHVATTYRIQRTKVVLPLITIKCTTRTTS